MASTLLKNVMLFLLAIFSTCMIVHASDPNILSDFIIPVDSNTTDANFFTFTGMRGLLDGPTPPTFKATKASLAEFPAKIGQSVSMALLQYPASSLNPPHTHPRSAELLFVVEGSLMVGFVDTTNKLYTQTLQHGDIFVFPKGLLHYQYNADAKNPATAVSAFASADAGTISVPTTVFATGIDDGILAKAFKTDVATITKIKAGLAVKV